MAYTEYANDSEKRKTVTLSITESCNLDCVYCYEHNKTNRTMSIDLAKTIIDNEMNSDPQFDTIEIDLFGGEAFLAFDTIKKITRFIREMSYNRKYFIFITTNGTLVHGEIQDWLRLNKDIVFCGLSLDGGRETQNYNRSNSFDLIDLDFFKELYPQQDIKMTISNDRLPFLFEDVVFCHSKGFRISNNLAYGIDWTNKKNETELKNNLLMLINYYLEHPYIEPCSLLNSGIDTLGYNNSNTVNKKWCGTGFNMRAYDIDGNKYPCQFFLPLSIGKEKAAKAKSIKFLKEIPNDLLDQKCRDCLIKELCPSCYGSNYAATGNIYIKDDGMCKLTKIIIKARAYFKFEQWKRGQLKDLDEISEQALLRSIVKINNFEE